ncbi:MAG: ABC transporter substrate-binding protein [Acidimicrobiales bacterium]
MRGRVMVLVAALGVVVAACGSAGPAPGTGGGTASTRSPSSSVASTGSSAPGSSVPGQGTAERFPLSVDTPKGRVTVEARPGRIVSLSPTATEMLFAIGAGSQVVAVDADSDYPPSAPRTKLSGLQPSIEAIASYHPDLVVASNDISGLFSQLAIVKITALLEPAATRLGDTYHQIHQLGVVTGHVAAADALVARMRRQIAAALAKVHATSPPLTYYYELDPTYYTVTSGTFVGSLLQMAGLRDIAGSGQGSNDYPQLSAEKIIQSNPDLVFLADTICCKQSAATVAARPGWSGMTAVRDGEVVALNDDVASRWGPRVVDLVDAIVKAVTGAPVPAGS